MEIDFDKSEKVYTKMKASLKYIHYTYVLTDAARGIKRLDSSLTASKDEALVTRS